MKTRGLADFRADYNIWRKDLAEELGLRETVLERMELTGEVPETVVQTLTEKYNLPENYFTEDAERAAILEAAAERYEPKKPLAYFFKVAFVWKLLVALVICIVMVPASVSVFFDYAVSDFFSVLETVCLCVVKIVSGIYLGSHIIQKTNFRGSIADYEFLYPFLPGIAGGFLTAVYSHNPQSFTDADMLFGPAAVLGTGFILTLLRGAVELVFLTFLLDTAARANGADKDKRLKILCAVTLAFQVISYTVQMIRGIFFDVGTLVWISRVLSLLLLFAVLYGVLFGVKKNPRLKTLWLTVLPIAAMVLPTVFTVLDQMLA